MPLQGDLSSIPIADVIQLISTSRRSGTLYVASEEDGVILQFALGHVMSATSPLRLRSTVGQILSQRGLVESQAVRIAVSHQRKSGKTMGEMLVDNGAVQVESLAEALRDQVQEAMDDLVHWDRGGFLFREMADDEVRVPCGISFNVGPLLMESLRKLDEWQRLAEQFQDRTALVHFTEDEAGSLPKGADDALLILEQVDGRRTVGEHLFRSGWSEFRFLRALGELLQAKLVQLMAPDLSRGTALVQVHYHQRIPALPRNAARAVAVAGLEDTGTKELYAVALSDPGLAVEVVKTAGRIGEPAGPFETLSDAISALGTSGLRRALTVAGLRGLYDPWSRVTTEGATKHSLVTSLAAARLASGLGLDERGVEMARMVGLVHDIGAYLLRHVYADRDRERALVAAAVRAAGASKSGESPRFGHEHIGAKALERWGMGADIVKAVDHHHAESGVQSRLGAILIVAEGIAGRFGYDGDEGPFDQRLCALGARKLGLTEEAIASAQRRVSVELSIREPLW